ncbi:MAG: hypothetical protein L0322_30570 [Chloroflexi bacterium]|nr:hypothetical protein [Chloroflexota bacterium]
MTAAAGIDDEDFVAGDLDLVAVEDRGGIGAEADSVDQQLRARLRRADGGGPLAGAAHHRVARLHPLAFEDDGAPGRRPNCGLAGGNGNLSAADLELHHPS